jgi:ankyrin repeat protein
MSFVNNEKIMKYINKNKWNKILLKYDPHTQVADGNNILHMACIRGNKEAIYKILKRYPQMFYVSNLMGETCSHLLLKHKWYDLFKSTFLIHPDIISFVDNQGMTVAQIAIDAPFILQWLIDKIPDAMKDSMNNLSYEGVNLLLRLLQTTTSRDIYYEIIQKLVNKGVDLNAPAQYPPLIYTSSHNKPELTRLLLENGANPNVRDESAQLTPLIRSIQNNDIENTKILLQHRADANYAGPEGDELPINIAIQNKNSDMLQLLLNNKPNLKIRDRNLETPLHKLLLSKPEGWTRPSNIYKTLYMGSDSMSNRNIRGETPVDLLVKNTNWMNYSELLRDYKTLSTINDIDTKTKVLDLLSDSKIDHTTNKYEQAKSKIILKRSLVKNKNNIKMPIKRTTNFGLFNSDILHNCIYTMIILEKYTNLMIPVQSLLTDKAINDMKQMDELAHFRTSYGLVLGDIVNIYMEYFYEMLPHLIVWRDKNLFYINPDLELYMSRLLNSPKVRFIYLKLTIIPQKNSTHANLILYDKKTKEAVRFEPYGFVDVQTIDDSVLDETLENTLKSVISTDIKYHKPREYMQDSRFQVVSSDDDPNYRKLGDPLGYCLAWCYWFMELRLNNPDQNINQLITNAFENILNKDSKENTNMFLDYIRDYSTKLDDEKNKFLQEIGFDKDSFYKIQQNDKDILKIHNAIIEKLDKITSKRLID